MEPCINARYAGQNVDMIDSLFTGGYLGTQSDIADGSLRNEEFRQVQSIVQPSIRLKQQSQTDAALSTIL